MFDPWVVLSNLSDPVTLLLMTLSACFGIIMGASPDCPARSASRCSSPLHSGSESATALMLGSVYCGSEYGGSIPLPFSSILRERLRPSTTFDGTLWPKGQAQKAPFWRHFVGVRGSLRVSALLFLSYPSPPQCP